MKRKKRDLIFDNKFNIGELDDSEIKVISLNSDLYSDKETSEYVNPESIDKIENIFNRISIGKFERIKKENWIDLFNKIRSGLILSNDFVFFDNVSYFLNFCYFFNINPLKMFLSLSYEDKVLIIKELNIKFKVILF